MARSHKKKLIIKERGWPELMAELRSLAKDGPLESAAGFMDLGPGSAVEHRGDLTNLELALVHEFGSSMERTITGTIKEPREIAGEMVEETIYVHTNVTVVPERSFIRSTYDENLNKYNEIMTNLARKLYEKRLYLKDAMGQLSLRMANDIRKKIDSSVPPPLSPEWATRKGSQQTLVDSGKMRDAVVAVVKSGVKQEVISQAISDVAEASGYEE